METILGIDLPTWWFLVVGAVFTGYALLDGFDLGAGALHLFFQKEESRRIALNAIGPVWDGNEVWLVIGGGTLFAGFPELYASLLSAFYIPVILLLIMLIFRAISIEFRSKEPMLWWKKTWDISYFVSSTLIALSLGLVLGNVLQGIPLDENFQFNGSITYFLNPYAILVAFMTLALFMMHGAIYLTMKTEGRLYAKLTVLVKNSTIFFVMMYALTTIATLLFVPHLAESFRENEWLFMVPVLSVLLIGYIPRAEAQRKYWQAFAASSGVIMLLLVVVATGLHPILLHSAGEHPENALTIYNAASSDKTIRILLIITSIGAPMAGLYTAFVFWTFKGKVKLDETSY